MLGTVDHFYWKKEYQAQGAPHYHASNVPYGTLLATFQTGNPILNYTTWLPGIKGTSAACTSLGVGSAFRDTLVKLQNSTPLVSLKSRNRIYELARTESEIRVNDYNPLLLMLWKANIDVRFVSESSLALAHYASGYVTKSEKSSMQEIWD